MSSSEQGTPKPLTHIEPHLRHGGPLRQDSRGRIVNPVAALRQQFMRYPCLAVATRTAGGYHILLLTQRLQNPVVKEYTSNLNKDPVIL